MKKVISYLLSILIAIQCLCVVPFNAFANESKKYSTCYTKFVLSDNSTEYTQSIIRDDCLMVDVQWLCDKLGLKYRKFNKSMGTSGNTENYFLHRNSVMSSAFLKNGFSVSKPDSNFSFVFQAGNKEAAALSGYLGSYSVHLGTEVTPVTDKNGNVSYYVPLFVFCNIFNAAYKICPDPESNYIALYEPDITVVDILHMQNSLSKYETHNCLVNAINDDVLTFLGMALGETIDNAIESALTLKWANGLDPTKDNYELLALQMCSSDTDEVDKIAAQNDRLDFFYSASTEVYGSLIEAAQEYSGNKQPLYEEIVKDEYRWSLSAWEKTKNQYDNVRDLGKVADISEVVNKYIGLGAPMIFNGLSLIFETASVQDNYLKSMNTYFEYADETLSKEEKIGYNYIQDRMKIYETSFDNAWILLSDGDMFSNITTFAAEELTGLQLGKLGLAATAGKWAVNSITGGAFDFNDIYYNCMVNQKFQNGSQKVVASYINSSDFDLDIYRALEWTRLKSYYVANENGLELYNQYYETSKFNADNNPTLNMLYDVGFGKKEKYSDAELEEFAKKVFEFAEELPEDEIYKKFGIEGIEIDYTGSIDLNGIIIPEAAFEDYNIMIGSKAILDYESKKINSDTEELAEYMAVLLYGTDGTTPENVDYCESFAANNNKWVLENNYALYQPVECKVVEAEEKTPVEDAEIIFTTDKGIAITCTTDEKGNMLGLDETISNSFADDINGNKNTQGILEENDPENQDNAFSQYEPNIKYSTVELYLPVGSYSLDIKASGYKDYKHESKVEVKLDEKCELGEILLERDDCYQIALSLMDTWITARFNNDKASADSVYFEFGGDDFSPLNGFVDYIINQIVVVEVTQDFFDYEEYNDYYGVDIEKVYQIDYRIKLVDEKGEYHSDTCSDCMIMVDGQWKYCPDSRFLSNDYREGGFAYYNYNTVCCSIVQYPDGHSETFYELENGDKISEEEYEKAVTIYYGYSVIKEQDGSFSLFPINESDSDVE